MRSTIRLLTTDKARCGVLEKEHMEVLRQAILKARKVQFHYSKNQPEADGNRHSVRTVSPYGIVLFHGAWVLVGQCDLLQKLRHFRLSRMNDLTVLEDEFTFPSHFNLQEHRSAEDRHIRVRIQVNPDFADKIKEANSFYLKAF